MSTETDIQNARQQLELRRQQIASQQEIARKNIQNLASQRALRSRTRTQAARAAVPIKQNLEARKQLIGAAGETESISQGYEQEVAEKAPEYGKPEYVEQAYNKAIEKIKPQVERLNANIESRKQQIAELEKDGVSYSEGQQIERLQQDIESDSARYNVLKGAISGDKVSTIKEVLSGNAEAKADYEQRLVGARLERQQAAREGRRADKEEADKLGISLGAYEVKKLAEQNPTLNAGELTDIARKLNIGGFKEQAGQVKQLEFSYSPKGELQYSKKAENLEQPVYKNKEIVSAPVSALISNIPMGNIKNRKDFGTQSPKISNTYVDKYNEPVTKTKKEIVMNKIEQVKDIITEPFKQKEVQQIGDLKFTIVDYSKTNVGQRGTTIPVGTLMAIPKEERTYTKMITLQNGERALVSSTKKDYYFAPVVSTRKVPQAVSDISRDIAGQLIITRNFVERPNYAKRIEESYPTLFDTEEARNQLKESYKSSWTKGIEKAQDFINPKVMVLNLDTDIATSSRKSMTEKGITNLGRTITYGALESFKTPEEGINTLVTLYGIGKAGQVVGTFGKIGQAVNVGALTYGTGQSVYAYQKAVTIEEKSGAAFGTALGLGFLGYGGVKSLKAKYGYEKYLAPFKEGEGSIARLKERLVVNTMKEDINVNKLSLVNKDNVPRAKINPKKKGVNVETEVYSTGELSGQVKEIRNIPSIKQKILEIFAFAEPKSKIYSGKMDVNLNTGIQTETINYGNKIKKITTFDTNTGKGKIELFKGNRLKLSRDITSKKSTIEPIIKKSQQEIKGEIDIVNPKQITRATFRKDGKEIKSVYKENRVGNKEGEIAQESDYLTSTKVSPNIKSKTIKEIDLESGVSMTTTTTSGQLDIIQSGSRKGMVKVSRDGTSFKFEREVAQNIVYGEPKEGDIARFVKKGTTSRELRKISPTTNRETISASQVEMEIIKVAPKVKEANLLQAERDVAKELIRIETIKKIKNSMKESINKNEQLTKIMQEKLKSRIGENKGEGLFSKIVNRFKQKEKPLFTYSEEGQGLQKMVGGNGLVLEEQAAIKLTRQEIEALNVQSQVIVSAPKIKNIVSNKYNVETNLEVVGNIGKTSVVPLFRINTESKLKVESETQSRLQSKTKEESLVKSNEMVKVNQLIKTEMKSRINQDMKINQLNLQQLKVEQLQQQEARQDLKLENKRTFRQEQRRRIPEQPKPIKIKLPKTSSSLISRLSNKAQEQPEVFEALVTKAGKDISLGKRRSQEEAESLLRGELKGTLRAGGTILKNDKPIRARELKGFGGGEFAVSKINQYKIIQKKEKRLSMRPETKELQMFKKSSKKKGGLF